MGDDAVLAFITPPDAGKEGTPLQSLVGFERVHVPAGESVTVTIEPELSHFSHVDRAGKRHALAGEYSLKFGLKESQAHGMGYAEATVAATLNAEALVL